MLFRAQKVLHLTALTLTMVQTVTSQELTEKELIERFLAQSPQVRALRAGLTTTRAEVRSRMLYPNPTANYSRTVKVIYEIDNRDRILAVGQSGFLRIFTSLGSKKPAVPEPAIVDDAGRPVVLLKSKERLSHGGQSRLGAGREATSR